MEEITLSMALLDCIPFIIFFFASFICRRLVYEKLSKSMYSLFSAGTIMILVGEGYKALYELLYALGVCDFTALYSAYYPMVAAGFVFAGIGTAGLFTSKKERGTAVTSIVFLPLMAVFNGTYIYFFAMAIGIAAMFGTLVYVSLDRKKTVSAIAFLVAFVGLIAMSYLVTLTFQKPFWIYFRIVLRVLGYAGFLVGIFFLRNDFSDFRKEEPVKREVVTPDPADVFPPEIPEKTEFPDTAEAPDTEAEPVWVSPDGMDTKKE